jgi:hypothetical protein
MIDIFIKQTQGSPIGQSLKLFTMLANRSRTFAAEARGSTHAVLQYKRDINRMDVWWW